MSALTFDVKVVGVPDVDDMRALLRDTRLENARLTKENDAELARVAEVNAQIEAENLARAAQDPPLPPLPLVDAVLQPLVSEDLSGYEGLLEVAVVGVHAAAVERARTDVQLTPEQTKEILLAVKDRVDLGENVEDILMELKEPKPVELLLEEIKP